MSWHSSTVLPPLTGAEAAAEPGSSTVSSAILHFGQGRGRLARISLHDADGALSTVRIRFLNHTVPHFLQYLHNCDDFF